ncbi:MAG: DUF72 domain-containing protein [Promethearchaeota archaeon]|nr:MAG: DUF72 domain-containing protein [Candidatus Lokiarchaeota archaeon]
MFYTNEINTTFYNIPSKRVVSNWVKRTPDDFSFSVKIPQTITHVHKLNLDECSESLYSFFDSMSPLYESGKLLAFLIQLPPSFKRDLHFEILKEFIQNWPSELKNSKYHVVIEFRDLSWMKEDIFSYLRANNLTYCAVIEPKLPPRMDITTPEFAYIRFHGYGKEIWFDYLFDKSDIAEWAVKIRNVIKNTGKICIYFNNHFSGYAVKNSLMLMEELGISTRKSKKDVNMLEVKKKARTLPKNQRSLDSFL